MGHQIAKSALGSSKLLAMGVMESVVALAYVVAKHTSRTSKKLMRKVSSKGRAHKWLTRGRSRDDQDFDFGDGVWQRSIMMGDRCQPLDFSGVIYYDCDGKRVAEPPVKSPRATPFVGYVAQHGGM